MLAATGCRKATSEKIQRDTENVRQYARFVIVLESGTPRLIDNGALFRSEKPFARIIAVVGPVHKGSQQYETVLLEVGYSRTRPYSQVEYHYRQPNGERQRNGRWYLQERLRVRMISDSELQTIYPILEQCMTQVVLECRERWQHKERWWVSGPGPVERGIYFTFDKADRSLYRRVLIEDIRFRKEEYIYGHVRRIHRLIGRYRTWNYSQRQLEKFPGVEKVANLVRDTSYWNPFYRRALLECFKAGSQTRLLLERMDEFFKLGFSEPSEQAQLVYDEEGPKLPPWKSIRARAVQQPTIQARNGLVVEVILERKFRENHECPF